MLITAVHRHFPALSARIEISTFLNQPKWSDCITFNDLDNEQPDPDPPQRIIRTKLCYGTYYRSSYRSSYRNQKS